MPTVHQCLFCTRRPSKGNINEKKCLCVCVCVFVCACVCFRVCVRVCSLISTFAHSYCQWKNNYKTFTFPAELSQSPVACELGPSSPTAPLSLGFEEI
jgi:hypothetical protein